MRQSLLVAQESDPLEGQSSLPNYYRLRPDIATAGQPTDDALEAVQKAGFKAVLNLRTEQEGSLDEKPQSRGTRDGVFQHPDWARGFLTGDRFEVPRHPGRDREPSHSNRVGAMWYIHQVLDNGESESSALEEAKKAGLRSEALEGRAKDYVAQNKPE